MRRPAFRRSCCFWSATARRNVPSQPLDAQSCIARHVCASRSSRGDREKNELELIIRRKSRELEAVLDNLGMDGLEDTLQDALKLPVPQDKRFAFGRSLSEAMQRVWPCALDSVYRIDRTDRKSTNISTCNPGVLFEGTSGFDVVSGIVLIICEADAYDL
jgi:hypothetical protein